MKSQDSERVLQELSKAELKTVVKSAIKEWLDEQALKFGKWTIRWLAMATLGVLLYFILTAQGYHK